MTVELLSRTADDDVIIRLFRVQNITRVGGSKKRNFKNQIRYMTFFFASQKKKTVHVVGQNNRSTCKNLLQSKKKHRNSTLRFHNKYISIATELIAVVVLSLQQSICFWVCFFSLLNQKAYIPVTPQLSKILTCCWDRVRELLIHL